MADYSITSLSGGRSSKLAIIIGFQYEQDIATDDDPAFRGQLPGISIDIYQAVKQSRLAGFDDIIVITDLYMDERTTLVNRALNDGIVDIDILELIKTLTANNEYYYYSKKKDILSKIKELLPNYNRLFIYYTGHAFRGYILFPRHGQGFSTINDHHIPSIDDDRWKIVDLKQMLIDNCPRSLQSVIVMDCCNGNGMNLPYIMKSGKFRLNDNVTDPWYFHPQQMICFSSAMPDEDSEAGRDGSTFSLHFFSLLREAKNNDHNIKTCDLSLLYFLTTIQNNCLTQYDQTAMIHVSHPVIRSLWPWLINDQKIEITVDTMTAKIIIKN